MSVTLSCGKEGFGTSAGMFGMQGREERLLLQKGKDFPIFYKQSRGMGRVKVGIKMDDWVFRSSSSGQELLVREDAPIRSLIGLPGVVLYECAPVFKHFVAPC